ncbi:MAG TPA: SRPBCC domain-containing protein [Candidatus Limnocylindrales bacterium]|nr:SRPBCC domain-containing protein [Candidatus Limnocylindrales bacterium]
MVETLLPITVRFETPASAADTWAALTEPALVAEWFTDASPLGVVGDPYRLDFGDGSVVEGVVLEVDRGHRFAYSWTWLDSDPPTETVVSWTVETLPDGGSRVTLVHDGWAEADADPATRADHEGYWTGYLDDLAALLAEGG